jgi:hypothetical protein
MIGDGDLGEVVIEAKGRDVVLFQASDGVGSRISPYDREAAARESGSG